MSTSVEELLLASLGDADWRQDPWHHAYVPETFPPPVARLLAEEFPASLLRRCRRTQGDKPYSFGTASLDGDERAEDIGPTLAAVGRALAGERYRRLLGDLVGLELGEARLTTSVWEYGSGDSLAPHVDKPGTLVTQIFYLTPDWKTGDGGRLLILGTSDWDDVRAAYDPVLGSSTVLVRSECSWHAVEAPSDHDRSRRSLTATFWTGD